MAYTIRIKMDIGTKYGRWTILKSSPNEGHKTMWLCRCDCGIERTVPGYVLRAGKSKSCGCLSYEQNRQRELIHGDAHNSERDATYLYSLWLNIKSKISNPNVPSFDYYGGRGVDMCIEWFYDYLKFKKWILENLGERPEKMSLDRIDNNKHYEPGNLKWSTREEQASNRNKFKSFKQL